MTDGLVAYYPFENDASRNGNHGTVHGAMLTKFGNANIIILHGATDNIKYQYYYS